MTIDYDPIQEAVDSTIPWKQWDYLYRFDAVPSVCTTAKPEDLDWWSRSERAKDITPRPLLLQGG